MDWNLYLAGDPISSEGYGPKLIKFKISESALVFDPLYEYNKVHPDFENFVREIYSKIEDEIISENQSLQECKYEKKTSVDNLPILVLLALEENRIGLVSYYGLRTPQFSIPKYNSDHQVISQTPYVWYALVSPTVIKSTVSE